MNLNKDNILFIFKIIIFFLIIITLIFFFFNQFYSFYKKTELLDNPCNLCIKQNKDIEFCLNTFVKRDYNGNILEIIYENEKNK